MGIHFLYTCPVCDYEFTGSGRPDAGMFADIYDAYNCLDCKQTFDYYVRRMTPEYIEISLPRTFWMRVFNRPAKHERKYIRYQVQEDDMVCSRCGSVNILKWKQRCPKCGCKMKNEGMVALWD